MLKFRRKKQDGQAGEESSSAVTATVRRPLWAKKRGLLVVAGVVVLAGAVSAYLITRSPEPEIDAPPSVSVEKTKQNELKELKNDPPAASASKSEQTVYYDKLVYALDRTAAYQDAIDAFNKRAAISTQGLDYYAYFSLARYYHEIGNAEGALSALDKAEALLPPSNPDEGYSKESKVEMINALRQEYQ